MHQFSPNPARIKEIRKPIIIRSFIIFNMILFVLYGIPELLSDAPFQHAPDASASIVLIVLTGIFAFSIFNSIKRAEKTLVSYKLTVTDDAFIRELYNTPTITLLKSEVKLIVKSKQGGYGIVGDSKINAIGVPVQIENAELLQKLLEEVKPVTALTRSWKNYLVLLPGLFAAAGMILIRFYDNKAIVIGTEISFIAFLLYSFLIVRKSKNVDTLTKRLSYVVFIPIICVTILLVIELMSL